MLLTKPLIIGIASTKLTKEERDFLQTSPVYGIILFKRNIESREQLKELVLSLKKLHNPLVFIDQEGGKVSRLLPPIVNNTYPGAKHFAELYHYEKSLGVKDIYLNYYMLMRELRDFGIDSPLSPVADLLSYNTHAIIKERSFGSEVEQVVDLCNSAISAIHDAQGIAVVKHIPGHGRATCDSHLNLPIVRDSIKDLIKNDFAVFKMLTTNRHLEYAMTGHLVFTEIDHLEPATLSSKVINFIREEIGFKGRLMTDDICMFALHKNVDFEGVNYYQLMESQSQISDTFRQKFIDNLVIVSQKALAAGCQYILHCSGSLEEVKAIYKAI